MSFLVILIALVANHYWTRDRDVLNDTWFLRAQQYLDSRLHVLPDPLAKSPYLYPFLILALPCLVLAAVLWLVAGVFFGLLSMAVHILVLLALFDRINVNSFTERYLKHWDAGDYEAAFLLLQQRWHQLSLDNCEDPQGVHREFCRFLVASFFERIFAIVFWYLLLGPIGALFYHLCVLYLSRVWRRDDDGDLLLLRLVYILEWVPARLLALTFSLAGDFVVAFGRLKEVVMSVDRSGVSVVYTCAMAAVEVGSRVFIVSDDSTASSKEGPEKVLIEAGEEDAKLVQVKGQQQLKELLGLLNRSQLIWVTALALLTLAGFGM
ncbi:MAG: regulatory signaling modulator protein AmpE [Pseudohongiellaceae bacterium]|nr:regulatory signaling modulator protein AmpE [Pseudohongiellaceae bacterium]